MTIVSTGSCNGAIASLSCRQGIGTTGTGTIQLTGSVVVNSVFSESATLGDGVSLSGAVTASPDYEVSLSGTITLTGTLDGQSTGSGPGPDDDGNSKPIDYIPIVR